MVGLRRSGWGFLKRVSAYAILLCVGLVASYFTGHGAEGQSHLRAAASVERVERAPRQLEECHQGLVSGDYPRDLFCDDTIRNGAFIFHIIGALYMFVALSIVVDEFFVPALEQITDRLKIDDDVAGATFMAAGGSAPELFTSFIGVFISRSSVGFGTIVGSAVFNILFVIGFCALFAKELLVLTWWPLFRDSVYYSITLLTLGGFFWDTRIEWWEALILFVEYFLYVTLMAYNLQAYKLVSSCCRRRGDKSISPQTPVSRAVQSERMREEAGVGVSRARAMFQARVLRAMLHNIDAKGHGPEKDHDTRMERAAEIILTRTKGRQKDKFSFVSHNISEASAAHVRDSASIEDGEARRLSLIAETGATETERVQAQERLRALRRDESLAGESASKPPLTVTPQQTTPQRPRSGAAAASTTTPSAQPAVDTSHHPQLDVQATPARGGVEDPEAATADGAATQASALTRPSFILPPPTAAGQAAAGGGAEDKDRTAEEASERKNAGTVPAGKVAFSSRSLRSHESHEHHEDGEQASLAGGEEEEDDDGDLLEWPAAGSIWAKLWFIVSYPLAFVLVYTVPSLDDKSSGGRIATAFFASIMWLGVFSYLMVWWTTTVSNTIGVSEEIAGLTFLAAGTSVPDLLSSVLVARQGLGDMAVSSSIGSNIFDVTVGLPLPWLFYNMFIEDHITVGSDSLLFSVTMLFCMLFSVILVIALSGWKMTKTLGLAMFFLYIVFVVMSLLASTGTIDVSY